MAGPNDISIKISAVNEASPELVKLQKDVAATTQAVQASSKQVSGLTKDANDLGDAVGSSHGLGRHFTALSSTIASQLNPALGQSGAFMSILGREVGKVSLGMTAFAVSAAIGVAAFVEYNKVLGESIARTVEIERQLATSDFAGATQGLTKAIDDLRTKTLELSEEPIKRFLSGVVKALDETTQSPTWKRFFQGMLFGGAPAGEAAAAAAGVPQPPSLLHSLFTTQTQEVALAARQGAFEQLLPKEVTDRVIKSTQDIAAAMIGLGQLTLNTAAQTLSLNQADVARAQILDDLKLKQDKATEALGRTQEKEREGIAHLFPGGVPANVASQLATAQTKETQAATDRQLLESTATVKALDEAVRNIYIERLVTEREILKIQGEYTLQGEAGLKLSEADLQLLDKRIASAQARGSEEKQTLLLLQLQGQEITKQQEQIGQRGAVNVARLQLAGVGATGAEATDLKIALERAKAATGLAQADLIQNRPDQQLQIERLKAESAVTIAQARFEQASKDNPLLGFQQGIKSVVDEWTAAGSMLKDLTRSVGAEMAQTMSDTFFNVVTGQFTKLSDVARQFGLNVLKSLTDTLSKALVGNLFQGFAQNLGLGGSGGFVRGLGVLGGGLSAGGLVEVGGQLFQSVSAGGGQTVLVPAAAAGVTGGAATTAASVAGGGTGPGGFLSLFSDAGSAIRAFLNTPLSSIAPSLFGSTLAPSVAAGASAAELQALGATGAEIQAATTGASATIGSALGATAAAAGLAFTIYNGLRNPPTAQNIGSSALSGAISGAILGAQFGGYYGAAVGAIAGGLLGGGAAAFGKPDPAAKKAREQAEANRAIGAASAVQGQVGQTQSLQELFDLLTANNTGYVGGTSAVAIVSAIAVPGKGDSRSDGLLFIGRPNSNYPVATLEEFAQWGPTTYSARIQAGVDASFLSGPNQSMTQAVRQKITELVRAQGQVELSTTDYLVSPFGGTVQRTSIFRGSEAGQYAGQQLSVEGPSLAGLSDAEKVGLLKQLAKLDQDLSLNILFRDPATDEIVSMSSTDPTGTPSAPVTAPFTPLGGRWTPLGMLTDPPLAIGPRTA